MQRRMPKSSKQRAKLYLYTLGSDAGAMPARFRRLSVFGWLICALALIIVSVETYAQDLEPRAFANTPVGLNFLIGAMYTLKVLSARTPRSRSQIPRSSFIAPFPALPHKSKVRTFSSAPL